MDPHTFRTDPTRGIALPNAGLPLRVQHEHGTDPTGADVSAGRDPTESPCHWRKDTVVIACEERRRVSIAQIIREVYGQQKPEGTAEPEQTQLELAL